MAITDMYSYIDALKAHDWEYEASSDQNVWRKGMRERTAICLARPRFDPNFELWNKHAPELLRRVAKPENRVDGEHKTGTEHRA